MDKIAKKSVTQQLLNEFGLRAKKKFGQNFLVDPSVIEKIVNHSGLDKETTVIEIGPGLGALTQQLAHHAKEVIAYEIDKQMVEVLNSWITDEPIQIIHQDFLTVDLNAMNITNCVICSNVPYYITTPIIFKCLESKLPFKQMTLMVQKEMAERLLAPVNTENYNALSVLMNLFFIQKNIMKVPANCFYPRPNVDSNVIALMRNEEKVEDYQGLIDFVKLCFTQRRKTLINNLKPLEKDIESILRKLGYVTTLRAQECSLEDFKKIYQCVYEKDSFSQA